MVSAEQELLVSKEEMGFCNTSCFCFYSWRVSQLETSATKEKWGKPPETAESVRAVFKSDLIQFFPLCFCQNLVVAVGAEGWFHLFDLTAATANKSDSSSQHEFLSPDDQRPFFTQHIPANTKVILISDIGTALAGWGCLTNHLRDFSKTPWD